MIMKGPLTISSKATSTPAFTIATNSTCHDEVTADADTAVR